MVLAKTKMECGPRQGRENQSEIGDEKVTGSNDWEDSYDWEVKVRGGCRGSRRVQKRSRNTAEKTQGSHKKKKKKKKKRKQKKKKKQKTKKKK